MTFSLKVFEAQEETLIKMFPSMGQLFHTMILALPISLIQKTYRALSGVSISNQECDNTISWLYQSLKKSLEKAAFGKLGKESNKISGAELLYTTQFFTDEYMVQYLVNMCLAEGADPFHVVFVDPAVGGGNFLTYAFSTLFDRQSKLSPDSPITIASGIIQKQLIGYDLDATLANIAQLSLYINVALKIGLTKVSPSLIFGGEKGDFTGYLSDSVSSNMIEGLSFESALENAFQSLNKICFVTNPPFMGKRDMDTCLKNYLVSKWPDCKGDLCFSFMNKLLQSLRPGDYVATVSQKFGYAIVNILSDNQPKENDVNMKLHMQEINAGQPFVVKVYRALNLKDVTFEDVTIDNAEPLDEQGHVKFIGTYTGRTEGFRSNQLYFSASADYNQYYPGNETNTTYLRPLGAFFELKGTEARVINFQEADGSMTAIDVTKAETNVSASEGWYTINGMKLDAAPTEKGIYINNGKKVVVK